MWYPRPFQLRDGHRASFDYGVTNKSNMSAPLSLPPPARPPCALRAPGGKARCGRPTAHVRVMIVDCPGLRRADARGPHHHLEPSPSPLCTLATRGRPRQHAALGDAASGARPPHCAHHSAPAFAMRHAHHSAPAFAMRHAHHSAPAFAIRHGATVYFVIVNSSATLPLLARV